MERERERDRERERERERGKRASERERETDGERKEGKNEYPVMGIQVASSRNSKQKQTVLISPRPYLVFFI